MSGSYFDYPRNLPLETPFGQVLLSVTDGNHVHVDFGRPEHPLIVRGQSVWGTLHLWRQPDDTFGPDGRRFGGFEDDFKPRVGFDKPACKTTRAKLLEAILDAVTAWARENGALFEAARREQLEADKRALREDI